MLPHSPHGSPAAVFGFFAAITRRLSGCVDHEGVRPAAIRKFLPRIMRRVGARRLVTVGLAALAAGELWLAATPISRMSVLDSVGPLLMEGWASSWSSRR